jgi:hypothetical protein
MKTLTMWTTLLTTGFLITACGNQSSDPIKEYKDQGLIIQPKSGEKSETQTIAVNPFSIILAGSNQDNNGQFIADQPGSAQIQVLIKNNAVMSYDLVITSFAGGNDITLTPGATPHVFNLNWTPKSSLIAAGKIGESFKIKLQARVTDKGPLKGIMSEEKEFTLNVTRNNSVPSIIGKSDLSKGLLENKVTKFSVDVEDPSSETSVKMPEILITKFAYSNTEAFKADASNFISLDEEQIENPKRLTNTKWRFFYNIFTEKLPIDRDRKGKQDLNSNQVELCFLMRAQSTISTFSIQEPVCFKGIYSLQAASVVDLDENLKEVKAKETVSFKFDISTDNGVGKINFPKASTELKVLTGKQKITCETETKTTCTVEWTPSCTTKPRKINFSLTIANQLDKQSKTSKFNKEFTVLADSEACKGGKK